MKSEQPLCAKCGKERPEPWLEHWPYVDYCPECSPDLDAYIESVDP